MNVVLEPGKYVLAVSGGVDSMVLLDVLIKQPELELIVAHFDHGIRADSGLDRRLVEQVAKEHHLIFEYAEGKLTVSSSEEAARKARYVFLHEIQAKYNADAIITAHHQDDLIETAFINILRGTGRKGLTALNNNVNVKRPLLKSSKSELIAYAQKNKLKWREDSTNQNTDYLRNYVRKNLLPKLSQQQRQNFAGKLAVLQKINKATDLEIENYLQIEQLHSISKILVMMLDHREACEVIAAWLRLNNVRDFDKKAIERLVISIKTLKPGSNVNINKGKYLAILDTSLVISSV